MLYCRPFCPTNIGFALVFEGWPCKNVVLLAFYPTKHWFCLGFWRLTLQKCCTVGPFVPNILVLLRFWKVDLAKVLYCRPFCSKNIGFACVFEGWPCKSAVLLAFYPTKHWFCLGFWRLTSQKCCTVGPFAWKYKFWLSLGMAAWATLGWTGTTKKVIHKNGLPHRLFCCIV